MATTLYMIATSAPSPWNGNEHLLSVTRGSGQQTIDASTTASGNHIVNLSGVTDQWFVYQVDAVTISGSISMNWWANESNMSANCGVAVVISRYDSAGAFVSDIVAQGNANHADGVELTVGTNALMTWSATPTSTSMSAGDYIVVKPHIDAVGTMGGGFLASLSFNGTTGGADGDTFVTFTETIAAFTPSTRVPYTSPYRQLLSH